MPSQIFVVDAANDGYVNNQSATYPPNGGVGRSMGEDGAYAMRRLLGGTYGVFNALLKWDTSSLAGKKVTAARLQIYVANKATLDNLTLVGESYVFDGTDADYTPTPSASAFDPIVWEDMVVGSQIPDITIKNPATFVNTSGYSGLRLHMTQLAADAAPTVNNFVQLATVEHATLAAPQLVVDYEDPIGQVYQLRW